MENIRTKDLNLLPILFVIAEERNLSRASKRLGLSQPALSHALSRLREQFNDPLFLRAQRGLVPTPRVLELMPGIKAFLGSAQGLFEPAELNLSRVSGKIVIASTTYFEALAGSRILNVVGGEAPGLRLDLRPLSEGFPGKELERGDIALAIAAYFTDLPAGFRSRRVTSEEQVCVCRKKNPFLKSPRGLKAYLSAKHLQIDVPPGHVAPADVVLRSKGHSREIVVRVGNFLTPADILAETDLLLTCPRSLAERYARMAPLAITDLPFALPKLETKMVWHERFQRDLLHAWVRGVVADAR